MSASPCGRKRAFGVRLQRSLFVAVAAIALAVGAGGAQGAGGAPDPTFGDHGKVLTGLGATSYDSAHAVAIQADGKIVAAGVKTGRGIGDFALVRYTNSGNLDSSFGIGGKVATDLGSTDEGASAVAVLGNGTIVVAGSSAGNFALVRYLSSGRLDASFGAGGEVLTNIGGRDGALALAIQRDGRIVAAGYRYLAAKGRGDFALVRYTRSGKLDRSFGTAGKVVTVLGARSEAHAVVVQPDGKIVAAGWSYARRNHDFALVRYTGSGKLDTSFGIEGKVVTDLGGHDDGANAVVIQANGKIVAVGGSDANRNHIDDFALVRYTTAGRVDGSFGQGGKALTDFGDGWANAVAVQQHGEIVAAGFSGDPSINSDFALVRYTKEGRLDSSFGSSGKVRTDLGGRDDWAWAVAVQADGRIVAAGFSDANGSDDFALVRYAH